LEIRQFSPPFFGPNFLRRFFCATFPWRRYPPRPPGGKTPEPPPRRRGRLSPGRRTSQGPKKLSGRPNFDCGPIFSVGVFSGYARFFDFALAAPRGRGGPAPSPARAQAGDAADGRGWTRRADRPVSAALYGFRPAKTRISFGLGPNF
jgi:hypothetical protein